ncbi:hypothetical protein [Streptomyces sp. NBC_01264]|uniref:hypothetical protein n=1 Tax=Streptomyces sp. NBC_01264 TaxID=2903804 RepID=UPI00224EA55C|nr:hypothetical protein [Streptomyces sp. NBC_01264]MCX4784038.1 hypothetical protein [Streptomyces sp. NBC_01264]
MTRPLGRTQQLVLGALARLNGGVWYPGCGWTAGCDADTARTLDSLVRRGYVARASASGRYAITEGGLNALGWYSCARCTRLTRHPLPPHPAPGGRRVRCSWCPELPTATRGRQPSPAAGHTSGSGPYHPARPGPAIPARAAAHTPAG